MEPNAHDDGLNIWNIDLLLVYAIDSCIHGGWLKQDGL